MRVTVSVDPVLSALHFRQLPPYLYKYRTVGDNLYRIMEEGTLWFSCPLDFNDPFDCQITVDTKNSGEEIEAYIARISVSKLLPDEAKRLAQVYIDDPEKWDQMIKDVTKRTINDCGICCFCGKHDNILLWSHYTDSHKGVCLKFDVAQDTSFFDWSLKVRYSPTYPFYNHLQNTEELVKALILPKAEIWAYEEEVRTVKFKQIGAHKFNKKALVEIIFGCNCPESDIQSIIEFAQKNDLSHVGFKKAVVKTDRYELDFLDL